MKFRAFAVTGGIIALTCVLAPFQLMIMRLKRPGWAAVLPHFYHRVARRMIGLDLRVVGRPARPGPVLFVSNHVSWLDISVLGAVVPTSFIAKREVGDWGPFGTLARLQRTVFIDRERRAHAQSQNSAIGERLAAGDNLVLFAEGTSSDGSLVLPFKSALFSLAETGKESDGPGVTVQPVTIVYRAINGVPLSRATRPAIGWYGDMELEPHFLNLLSLGRIAVDVWFHAPVSAHDFASRKALAAHCYEEVREGLLAARRSGILAAAEALGGARAAETATAEGGAR